MAPTGTATPTSTSPPTASSWDDGFVWGPEGFTEAEAGILGDLAGRDVLEVGSGAGQCSRWVRGQGGRSYGLDLSHRQLQHSRRIDVETGIAVP
jgi:2-polyprenyl-3-methyl-5-hydroxy-6-metoxy-1,4-benzoquinol methylase